MKLARAGAHSGEAVDLIEAAFKMGLVVEGHGPGSAMGGMCEIYSVDRSKSILSEVVGRLYVHGDEAVEFEWSVPGVELHARFGDAQFASMKDGVRLVNTARGGIYQLDALAWFDFLRRQAQQPVTL